VKPIRAAARTAAVLCLCAPALAAAQAFDLPDIPVCLELAPGAVALSDESVTLQLRVVLDGVSQDRGEAAVAAARSAYVPLNVALAVSYEIAGFSSSDGAALIEEAKRRYGGRRPAGAHAVYVLTSKDLYLVDETGARDTTLVGLADCIGGIAYPEHAFAVGEAIADDPFNLVYAFGRNLAGKTLGHEVGHLVGGHHHYANCAETVGELDDAPCTLMINDLGLAALHFSSLNGLTIRGHAQLAGSPGFMQSDESAATGGAVPLPGLLVLIGLAALRRRSAGRVSFSKSRTSAAGAG
jgi:hypothetical protein